MDNHRDSANVPWDSVRVAADSPIRTFDTGATRSSEDGKIDPEGFLSPLVLVRYSEYMQKHRTQPDGSVRASDNWQKGIPLSAYMKSMWRHFLDVWLMHRGHGPVHSEPDYDMQEALCALIFNASGYLDTILKD
jgi:hypothetical protein